MTRKRSISLIGSVRNYFLKIIPDITCIFFIAGQILFASVCSAQVAKPVADNYSVQHFGEEDGLQNSINCILPDKDDFLWIATGNGLARFNGTRLLPLFINGHRYKNDFNNVTSLHYKSKDTILAYSNSLKKVAVIVKDRVVRIEDQKFEQQGILFWNQEKTIPAPPYISGNYYTSAFSEKMKWKTTGYRFIGGPLNKDTIWFLGNDAIWFYDKKGQVPNKINIPDTRPDQIISVGKYILYLDNTGFLNYYTSKGLQKRELISIPGKKKLSVVYDRSNDEVFYFTADSSLYKAYVSVSGKLSFRQLIPRVNYPTDLKIVFEKDSNTVITGTFSHGLYIYKKELFKVSAALPDGSSNAFFLQHLLPDGQTIFVGNGYVLRDGLYYSKKIKGFEQLFFGIVKDSKGWYWYPIQGHILRTRKIGAAADTIKTLAGQFAKVLLEDKAGRLWVASEFEFGYFQNDHYTAIEIKAVINLKINCLKQDVAGKYYIGTDRGLFVLDNIDQGNVKEIPDFRSTAPIRSITIEADGSIWVFTYGSGFFLISKNKITSFSGNDDKLNFIHTIVEDTKGYCWFPSNNGLFVTTKRSLIDHSKDQTSPLFFYMFSTQDGLPTNEFNGSTESAVLKLPNGNMSLTSMDGLVQFDPSKMHFYFSPYPIHLDLIVLDSTEIKENNVIHIGPAVKNIRFSISTAYWGHKENDILEYQVIRKGITKEDGQWLQIDRSGNINLFSPGYGNYQLVIRKRTGFGLNDILYKRVDLIVLPKWYQTSTFIFTAILSAMLLMIAIFFLRRNYYRRTNSILKEKVDTATFKLQQMNNTLEQKIVERTLAIQQAEIKFGTLVEGSLVGVYILQGDSFVYVNPKFEEILGYDHGELVGTKAIAIINEEERALVIEKMTEQMLGKTDAEHYEVGGLKKDGGQCQLEFFGNSTIYEDKPTVIGTMIDITERKKMETELREAEMKFRDLVEKSLVGVYITKDGTFAYVNPRFAQIFGYSQDEMINAASFNLIVHEDDRKKVADNIQKRMLGKTEYLQYELKGIKKDGSIVHLDAFGRTTQFKGGPAIIGTLIDITEKKLLEDEIEKQKTEEQKNMVRAILASEERERNKIGQELHDNVNQILSGTKLYLSTARRNAAKGEDIINESIELIDSAIDEIRALSKGKVTPVKEVNLEEILRSLVDRLAISADIKTRLQYKGSEQPVEDNLKLNIYRIVQELLNNTLKHAKASKVEIFVQVDARGVMISVSDDGKGFDTKAKKEGIGISNIMNRVELFNGAIKIQSSEGLGCKVEICLPF